MKYQVRVTEIMTDKPMSGLYETREEAEKKLEEVRKEICATWATPCPECAYIYFLMERRDR